MPFLKQFYRDAYKRLRAILPKSKTIVFHDGFRLGAWKDFFVQEGMENVVLDTHIYVFAMENFVPIHKPWVYKIYIDSQVKLIQKVQKYTPVIVGEWCICNKYAEKQPQPVMAAEEAARVRRERYREMSKLQLDAWSTAYGCIYWNYQLLRSRTDAFDERWKESWDLSRCLLNGWLEFSK